MEPKSLDAFFDFIDGDWGLESELWPHKVMEETIQRRVFEKRQKNGRILSG